MSTQRDAHRTTLSIKRSPTVSAKHRLTTTQAPQIHDEVQVNAVGRPHLLGGELAVDVELQLGEAGIEAAFFDQLLMGAGRNHPALV